MFRWCAGTSTARWAVLITLCAVELVNVWSEASHAHHQREGRSGDERSGARGKRPIVCAQLQTGNSGPAGNREVAARKEVSHGRQRVDVWCPGQSQRLTDVLGVHDDLAEVGRGVSRGGGSAADDGVKSVERLGGGAAPMLD